MVRTKRQQGQRVPVLSCTGRIQIPIRKADGILSSVSDLDPDSVGSPNPDPGRPKFGFKKREKIRNLCLKSPRRFYWFKTTYMTIFYDKKLSIIYFSKNFVKINLGLDPYPH